MARLIQPKTEEEIRKVGVAAVRKSYIDLANDYNRIINDEVLLCPKCNDWSLSTGFYADKNYATGKFPICKRCLIAMVEQRDIGHRGKQQEPNETKESVQKVLRLMDRIYDDEFYEDCIKGARDEAKERNRNSPFATYITAISSLPQWKGKTWADSIFDESVKDDTAINEESQYSQRIIRKGRNRFGEYSNKDLFWLEKEYEDWITRYPCDSKAQEALFQTLVCQRLEADKARKGGKPTKDLDREVRETMTALGIKPSQTDANALTDQLTFGQLISKWEEEKPVPEMTDEFKDVDHIGTYIDVFFKGHLSKMMGLKNAFSTLYDKYIAKYRVTKPVVNEEEEEVLFNQIFNAKLGGDD